MVRVAAHRQVAFRREHDVVTLAAERLGEDLLRLARAVHVRRVDEVDAGVQRRVRDADAVVVVGVAPRAEHHRTETELADLDARAPERAVLQFTSLPAR